MFPIWKIFPIQRQISDTEEFKHRGRKVMISYRKTNSSNNMFPILKLFPIPTPKSDTEEFRHRGRKVMISYMKTRIF